MTYPYTQGQEPYRQHCPALQPKALRDGDEQRFGSSTGNRIALCGVAVLVKSTNKKTNKKESDPTAQGTALPYSQRQRQPYSQRQRKACPRLQGTAATLAQPALTNN